MWEEQLWRVWCLGGKMVIVEGLYYFDWILTKIGGLEKCGKWLSKHYLNNIDRMGIIQGVKLNILKLFSEMVFSDR